jgi:ribosomal protein S18 acetylase RimI-like enzyme
MAHWARNHGATTLALAVTQRNNAARGLYEGLGMEQAGVYHYRGKSA